MSGRREKWGRAGAVLTICLALCTLAVFAQPYGRLAQPERKTAEEDKFIGFHMVFERMPKEGEERPVDETHWVEYGEQDMEVEGLGTLAVPRRILIGEFQDDPQGQDYCFPGLPGLNCFLSQEEMEGGGVRYAGTSGLADAHIKVGDRDESISGTVYFGPPVDDRNWNTEDYDYGWTAYRVYQMEDGTVYLDGSGNSYGGVGGFTVSEEHSETWTAGGTEQASSFQASVSITSVERIEEVQVVWFGPDDRPLERRALSPEEAEGGQVLPRPQGAVWALVTELDRTGAAERSSYTLGDEGVSHRLVLLDQRGMGRVASLELG